MSVEEVIFQYCITSMQTVSVLDECINETAKFDSDVTMLHVYLWRNIILNKGNAFKNICVKLMVYYVIVGQYLGVYSNHKGKWGKGLYALSVVGL